MAVFWKLNTVSINSAIVTQSCRCRLLPAMKRLKLIIPRWNGKHANSKAEILHYLKGDCVTLHKMVSLFIAEFGMRLTIGGTAMNELKQFHPYDPVRKGFDEAMRPFILGALPSFEKESLKMM